MGEMDGDFLDVDRRCALFCLAINLVGPILVPGTNYMATRNHH